MSNNSVNNLLEKEKGFQTSKKSEIKVSTFSDVRISKSAVIQSNLTAHLKNAIGDLFQVEDADYQSTPDYNDPDKLNYATVYTVRSTNRNCWLGSRLFEIKVKDQKPIVSAEEIQKISDGDQKPVVLRFIDLSYYHYAGGETLTASSVEKVNISPREARERGL